MVADHVRGVVFGCLGREFLGGFNRKRQGLFGEQRLAERKQSGHDADHVAVLLRGDDAVEFEVRGLEGFEIVKYIRNCIACGDRVGHFFARFHDGNDLDIGQNDIVFEMRHLAHAADAEKYDFCHINCSFIKDVYPKFSNR